MNFEVPNSVIYIINFRNSLIAYYCYQELSSDFGFSSDMEDSQSSSNENQKEGGESSSKKGNDLEQGIKFMLQIISKKNPTILEYRNNFREFEFKNEKDQTENRELDFVLFWIGAEITNKDFLNFINS